MKVSLYLTIILSSIFLNTNITASSPKSTIDHLLPTDIKKCSELASPKIYECILTEKYRKYYYVIRNTPNDPGLASIISHLEYVCNNSASNEFMLMECVVGVGYAIRSTVTSIEKFVNSNQSCNTFHLSYNRLWEGNERLQVDIPRGHLFCDTVDRLSVLWDISPVYEPCGADGNVDVQIAVCVGGAPGTGAFTDFWTSAARACDTRKPIPRQKEMNSVFKSAMRERGYSERQLGDLKNVDCQHVSRIAERFGILTKLVKDQRAEADAQALALRELRSLAADGSPTSRFLLAMHLMEIDNFILTPVSRSSSEAYEVLKVLAKEGYQDAVFRMASELERRFPEPPNMNSQFSMILGLYSALARADDPRGHIKLAEEDFRLARFDMDRGDRAAAMSDIASAKRYLEEGFQFASGDLANHMSKMHFELRKLENSPSGFHLVTSAFLSGSAFIGTWKRDGFSAAVDQTEDCLRNKPPVDLDPNFRLAFSLFGCIPY